MLTPKISLLTVSLLTLAPGPGFLTTARADSRISPMPSAGLVILPETNLRLTGRNQGDYDQGPVNSLDASQIEHRFTLRNDGIESITITQFQPSCHCTAVTVESVAGRQPSPTEETNPTLLPGLEMVVKVTVQLTRQPAGPLSQGVYIFALGYDGPIARLHLATQLTTGITVTPTALDFGPIKSGETQSRKITFTFDDRLVSGRDLPSIISQIDPRQGAETAALITVTPEPEIPPQPQDSTKTHPATRTQTYLVTIRPAHSGDLAARLFFAPLSQSEYTGTVPYDTASEVLREQSVPLWARVSER